MHRLESINHALRPVTQSYMYMYIMIPTWQFLRNWFTLCMKVRGKNQSRVILGSQNSVTLSYSYSKYWSGLYSEVGIKMMHPPPMPIATERWTAESNLPLSVRKSTPDYFSDGLYRYFLNTDCDNSTLLKNK